MTEAKWAGVVNLTTEDLCRVQVDATQRREEWGPGKANSAGRIRILGTLGHQLGEDTLSTHWSSTNCEQYGDSHRTQGGINYCGRRERSITHFNPVNQQANLRFLIIESEICPCDTISMHEHAALLQFTAPPENGVTYGTVHDDTPDILVILSRSPDQYPCRGQSLVLLVLKCPLVLTIISTWQL